VFVNLAEAWLLLSMRDFIRKKGLQICKPFLLT